MSGEFRWTGNEYLHVILSRINEPGQGELSKLLFAVYESLVPLERTCAWVEAADSHSSECLIAAYQEGDKAIEACQALITYLQNARDTVIQIVRKTMEDSAT